MHFQKEIKPRRVYTDRQLLTISKRIRILKKDFAFAHSILDPEQKEQFKNNLYALRQERRNRLHTLKLQDEEKTKHSVLFQVQKWNESLFQFMKQNKRPPQDEPMFFFDENKIKAETNQQKQQQVNRLWNNVYSNDQWQQDQPTLTYITPPIIDEFETEMAVRDITVREIRVALKLLKNKTSTGYTNILPEALKWLSFPNILFLHKLFNSWWLSDTFPQLAQVAKVKLLHKKNSKHEILNHRTIAMSCNVGKVYCRVVEKRLSRYIEQHKILGELQNGFRKGRRAVDNLFVLSTLCQLSPLNAVGKAMYMAFIDIEKAYDRVNRQFLFQKLRAYGLPPKIVAVLQSMYTEPKMVVMWDSYESEPYSMHMGLKQGCVLSPILFSLYLADLQNWISENNRHPLGAHIHTYVVPFLAYADDITFCANTKPVFLRILSKFQEFCNSNHLMISTSKSAIMTTNRSLRLNFLWHIGYKQLRNAPPQPVQIKEVAGVKYLGVDLTRGKNIFRCHEQSLLSKLRVHSWMASTSASRFYRQVPYGSQIWKMYVLPAVFYASEIFLLSKNLIAKLNVLQNQFMRNIMQMPQYTATVALQFEFEILPLKTYLELKQMQYYFYISHVNPSRIVHITYQQHLQHFANQQGKWIHSVQAILQYYGIPTNALLTNQFIKQIVITNSLAQSRQKIMHMPSLCYYGDKLFPQVNWQLNISSTYKFWLKLRIGALWLGDRSHQLYCESCNSPTLDSLSHALFHCSGRPSEDFQIYFYQQPQLWFAGTDEEKITFLLSDARAHGDRLSMGDSFRRRLRL